MGMWPCGIILLVAELFRSESKSEVYASIHEFLWRNTKVSSTLSDFVHTITMDVKTDLPTDPVLQSTYVMMMGAISGDMPRIQFEEI